MNEINQLTEKPQHLWSAFQISFATALAGPIAGCYFLGKNFQQFGEQKLAKRCYFVGLMGAISLVTILFFVPEKIMDHIPRSFIPIALASSIGVYVEYFQKQQIQTNRDQGAKRFSYWWWLLMIISFLVIQIPLVFLWAFLLTFISQF